MATSTRSRSASKSGQFQAVRPPENPHPAAQNDHLPPSNPDTFRVYEDAVATWRKSKAALQKTKADIETQARQRKEEQDRLDRQERERQQKEREEKADQQKKQRQQEEQERQRKQRALDADSRAKAMSTSYTSKDSSSAGSVYRTPGINTAPTLRAPALPTKTVKIYWDISKDDAIVADTIRLLMSKLRPQPERFLKGNHLPARGAVLFGFVWIVSRADIADEDATTLWQQEGAFSALTVCYANPGNEAFLRPAHYVGAREGMIHFCRGKHGDLIRASWILSGAKPEFETDEDAESRGRRIGVEVLGEGKLIRKLQALADQAAV